MSHVLFVPTDLQQLRRVTSLAEVAQATGRTVDDLRRASDEDGLPVHNVLGTELVLRGELEHWAASRDRP